jgi:DNA mismatch endonuclease, patch repair protein
MSSYSSDGYFAHSAGGRGQRRERSLRKLPSGVFGDRGAYTYSDARGHRIFSVGPGWRLSVIEVPAWPASVDAGVSRSMRANRRRDTQPELQIRSLLHGRGRRFRVDFLVRLEGARVRPDVAFTRARLAVFVDGCFWHSCPQHGHPPKSHSDYWTAKLARNVQRDERNNVALAQAGWRVIRIWEHVPVEDAVAEIEAALARRPTREHQAGI